jgi:hypothetical protein
MSPNFIFLPALPDPLPAPQAGGCVLASTSFDSPTSQRPTVRKLRLHSKAGPFVGIQPDWGTAKSVSKGKAVNGLVTFWRSPCPTR